MPLDSRKVLLFYYLLVVTKRRFGICKFRVDKSKDLPPTASRLLSLISHRAALQRGSREKHKNSYCSAGRNLSRAAGEGAKSFLFEI
jgi:hypothetical protein